MAANLVSTKFLFLQQDHVNFHPSLPKGITWHFIETKTIKHYYYSSVIMWTYKTVGVNIGLPPNKRYRLTPLARHDDFNDAHIKDKNCNIKRAS